MVENARIGYGTHHNPEIARPQTAWQLAGYKYCSVDRAAMDRLEQLLGFLEQDPDDEFTLFAVASEYRRKGKKDLSLEYFERLRDASPDYLGTYYHLASLYLEIGQTDRAIETYRSGILVAESQRDAHARAELQSALMDADGGGFN